MIEAAAPSRRFTIAQLALLVPWVALVIGSWGPIQDNSFLWHVRAGTAQILDGNVITTEPFSFTVGGLPWTTQSWLVELLYGQLETWFGLSFVPWMILTVGTLFFVVVALLAYRSSGSLPATAFVLVLTTIALTSFLVPRPVLFSYLLMALVVYAWGRESTRWTIPLLFWLWAAIHASFVIGLAFIGLSIFMKRDWHALPTAVAAGLVTLFTAHGVGVLSFLFEFASNREGLDYISEWRRPELLEPLFLPVLGGLVYIAAGLLRRTVSWQHLWLTVPFGMLAFTSVRAVPPAWIGLVPIVAASLAGLSLGSKGGLRPKLALVFAVFVLLFPFLLTEGAELSEERFPIEASRELTAQRTLHDDKTGGYLIWAQWPERQVYIDDRAELYGDRLGEFIEVRSGEVAWEPIFERDGIEQVLLPVETVLVASLDEAGWTRVYEDEHFVVLRKGR